MSVLFRFIFTAHEFKLETRILVEADNTQDDESGLDRQGQGDHSKLSIISRIPNITRTITYPEKGYSMTVFTPQSL